METQILFFVFFSLNKGYLSLYNSLQKDLSNNKLSKIINEKKIDKNFKKILCIIISSVVPDVDKILKAFFEKKSLKFFFLKDIIHKFRLKTKIRIKKENWRR